MCSGDPVQKQLLYPDIAPYRRNSTPRPRINPYRKPPTPTPVFCSLFCFQYDHLYNPKSSELHHLLRPDPSTMVHFDLSFFEFLPEDAYGKPISAQTLAEPATSPPTSRLTVTSDDIPKWPILLDRRDFRSPTFPAVTLGDVLSGIHKMMQTQITLAEWAPLEWETLHEMNGRAVIQAYARRQESRIAAGGVRRVDFPLKRVMFAGLVQREKRDQVLESVQLLVKEYPVSRMHP